MRQTPSSNLYSIPSISTNTSKTNNKPPSIFHPLNLSQPPPPPPPPNATMEPHVVITSSTHPTATWPHATVDCLSKPPCSTCYCYVCDVPIAQCDDHLAHEAADGKQNHWNIIKRRRNALVNTWADIPALVNLIVSLSVEEAVRRADRPNHTHDDVTFLANALEQVQLHNVNVKHQPHHPQSDNIKTDDAFLTADNPVPTAHHIKVHTAQKVTTSVKTEPH